MPLPVITAKIDDPRMQAQIDGINKTVEGINAIPVSDLKQPVATPIVPKQPVASTSSANLSGFLNAGADKFNTDLTTAATAAEQNKGSALDALIKNTIATDGKTALTATEYANTGVDKAASEVKDINNQILAEDRAAQNEIRALKENPEGLYGGALEQKIQTIQDKSTQRQADLAIIQLSKQGKYDSAKTIADRAIAAKFERQQALNEALKLSYEDAKDTFSEKDRRAFETAQKDRERNLNFEMDKEKLRYENLIKQSDPLYQAQLAKAQQEVEQIGVLAQSGLTTQAGYKKLNPTQKGKADALNNLIVYLDDYKNYFNDNVGNTGINLTGDKSAVLETKLNALLFAAAQAEGTGALQAADRAVLEKVIPNPTTFVGAFNAGVRGGKVGSIAKIDDQLTKYKNNLTSYGVTPVVPPPQRPGVTSAPSVNISGQSVPVGSVIENAQGKRATVNADGTVTPI